MPEQARSISVPCPPLPRREEAFDSIPISAAHAPKPSLPTREEALDYILSFDLFEQYGGKERGEFYAKIHVDRFLKTLRYLPRLEKGARILELGAAPYMMSFLVMRHFGYDLTPANFFGDYGETLDPELDVTISSEKYGDSHRFEFKLFNLERDLFPYADGEFDVVLCCEILEHLAVDPAHMLGEIHRVLKPGGSLVLTTPNATQFNNVMHMLRGGNIYHRYSGAGIYERHNREYSPGEVASLLAAHNFEPRVECDDAYPHGKAYRLAARLGLLKGRQDNIFATGKKHGLTTRRRVDWLYDNPNGYMRVRHSHVVMGQFDWPQLGPGWGDYEYRPPGIRWVRREATVFLLPSYELRRVGFRAMAPPEGVSGRLLVNGHEAGCFDLKPGRDAEVVFPVPPEAGEMALRREIYWFDVTIAVDDAGAGGNGESGLPVERIELVA